MPKLKLVDSKGKDQLPSAESRQHMRDWVREMLSGNYKQTQKVLKRKNEDGVVSYCCLGIQCEIYHKATGNGFWSDLEHSYFVQEVGAIGFFPGVGAAYGSFELPQIIVSSWFGLGLTDPSLRVDADDIRLNPAANDHGIAFFHASELNDRGFTFAEIAQAVERTYDLRWNEDSAGVP